MPKLRRSLERAARRFGDTNKTAVARWGVQTCRELAVSTQIYGKGGARKKQIAAIEAGVHAVIAEVTDKQFARMVSGRQKTAKIRNRWVTITKDRLLATESDCQQWIESRRGEKGHTETLDQFSIGIAPKSVVRKVLVARRERAGAAKGGFIGAGLAIATRQKGADRITIGKNFLGYAHKHSKRGSARASGDNFKPIATLSNRSRHSGSGYVLSSAEKSKAVGFGLRKTITWYSRAAKRALDKS
jgi:hypothetical protein